MTHATREFRLRLLLLIICFAALAAQAQRPDSLKLWKVKTNTGISLSQASFSSNWNAGGVNSVGLNTLLNIRADYERDKTSWDTQGDFLYGFVDNSGVGNRKTVDRLYVDTKFGLKISPQWNLFASLNLQSQFAKGYKYDKDSLGVEHRTLISDLFAPGFITSAVGLEYHPVDYFQARLSPMAPRITIVNGVERFVPTLSDKPYGVAPGDVTRIEPLAFQLLASFNKDLMPNLNLKWRFYAFGNYQNISFRKIEERIDLDVTAKISKFISAGVGGILIYLPSQSDQVQWSQALTLGLVYSFQNYTEPAK